MPNLIDADADASRSSKRLTRLGARFSRRDRRSLIAMGLVVLALHVVGITVLVGLVVPQHLALGGDHPIFSVGVGVLAYTFGLRHAFDADHIAAVDNGTRKLIADEVALRASSPEETAARAQPLSVGFWFSLGHSTIVFTLSLLLAFGVRALVGPMTDESSSLHAITGIIGPSVSGVFLWMLGLLNLGALIGILRVFRDMRRGAYDEAALEKHLDSRGFMNRFLGVLTKSVRKPWHIYPVGVLFGLGFDTATEVGLLVLAAGVAAFSLPFYAILVLPILFAAGMCLMDTIDGIFMNTAYGWAFARPVRKVFYNLTVTTISILVALVIGSIELAGVAANGLGVDSGPLAWLGGIDLNDAGFVIVGVFVVAWLVALAVWRFGRIEQRWSDRLAD
jgi:high-affinity nickel-transport protein